MDCSLCTSVGCIDCPRIFPWGDQFRRKLCPCGGEVEVRPTIKPETPELIHIVPRISECVRTDFQFLPLPQPARPVFERWFERRCCCCNDVETLSGLVYLSYDDPGRLHEKYICFNSWSDYKEPQELLGGDVDDLRLHMTPRGGDVGKTRMPRGAAEMLGEDEYLRHHPYSFPKAYADQLRECRGMFFPRALCRSCQRGHGRAIHAIYTVPMKWTQYAREKAEEDQRLVSEAVSLTRGTFPNASPAWPIDSPAWRWSAEGNRCFTEKWLGQAFFICRCRRNPRSISPRHPSIYAGQRFRNNDVFYRCPFLEEPILEEPVLEEPVLEEPVLEYVPV